LILLKRYSGLSHIDVKGKSDFDDKTILELENIFKASKTSPESLIEILRGDPW